jgi:hypothetical protein
MEKYASRLKLREYIFVLQGLDLSIFASKWHEVNILVNTSFGHYIENIMCPQTKNILGNG